MTIPEELHYVLLNFLGSVLNSKVNVFILNLIKKASKPISKFVFQSPVNCNNRKLAR